MTLVTYLAAMLCAKVRHLMSKRLHFRCFNYTETDYSYTLYVAFRSQYLKKPLSLQGSGVRSQELVKPKTQKSELRTQNFLTPHPSPHRPLTPSPPDENQRL